MAEDPTTDLTADEKLNRILAELADMKARLSALEAAAEDCARETRPKLDLLIKEMADTRGEIREIAAAQARLEQKLDVLVDDSMHLRAQQKVFDRRLSDLERRPN